MEELWDAEVRKKQDALEEDNISEGSEPTTNQYGLSSRQTTSEDAELAKFVERLKAARKRMRDEESRLSQLSEEDEDNLSRFHKPAAISLKAQNDEKNEDNISESSYDAYKHLMPKTITFSEMERMREAELASEDGFQMSSDVYKASEIDNVSQMTNISQPTNESKAVKMSAHENTSSNLDTASRYSEWPKTFKVIEDDVSASYVSQHKAYMMPKTDNQSEWSAKYRVVEDDSQSLETAKDISSLKTGDWSAKYRVYEKGEKPKKQGYRLTKKDDDASEESVSKWTKSEKSIKDLQKDDKKMSVAPKDEKSLKSLTSDWSEKLKMTEDMSMQSMEILYNKGVKVQDKDSGWSQTYR